MSDDQHRNNVPLADLHQSPQGGGGKGCLSRHPFEELKRTANHHCSHQWMAQKRAEGEDRALYNYPAYRSLELGPGQDTWFATGASATFPKGHAQTATRPRKREWDVGRGQNFKHFLKPYWHNAHHLIPNGTLRAAIDDAGEDDPSGRVVYLIRAGLLKGEYNLNDKSNMMILPMGAAVANALGLPRHLNGDQGGARQFFNHPDYNARIKGLITPVIDRYKALVKQKEKEHPKPPEKLSKDSLVSISDTIHSTIKALSKRTLLPNNSLDSVFGRS